MRVSQRSLIAVLAGVALGLVLLGVRQNLMVFAEPDPCVVAEVDDPTPTTESTVASTTTVALETTTTTTLTPETTTTTVSLETTTTVASDTTTTVVVEEPVDVGSMSFAETNDTTSPQPDPLAPLAPEPSTTTTEVPTSTTIPGSSTTTSTSVPESTTTVHEAPVETTTTISPVPDIDCLPLVEILEFPGWGSPDDVIEPVIEGGEDDVVVVMSETTVPTTVPPTEVSVPPTQPPMIQPEPFKVPDTSNVYTVSATITVGAGATLKDLDTVTMCWYKPTAPAPIAAGTQACSVLNPQTEFKMVWTEASEASVGDIAGKAGFSKAISDAFPSNQYRKAAPQVETTADTASFVRTATSMTVRFSFRVSPAMLAGTDWRVSVSAMYDTGLDANPVPSITEQQNLSVGYWSEVSTPREPMDFGSVPPGGQRTLPTVPMGTYRANGPSQLTMTGKDYSCVGCTLPLGLQSSVVSAPDVDPGAGRVSLDCRAGDLVPVRLTGAGTAVAPLAPTGEDVATLSPVTCTIKYGGGAERALSLYSGPVVVTITRQAS